MSYRCIGCERLAWEQDSWKEENAKGIRVALEPKGQERAGKLPSGFASPD